MVEIPEDAILRLALVVRDACLRAVLEGYEQARMDGLCDEGALEVALDAVRSLDVMRLVREVDGRAVEL